jgi:F-box interacting protein
LLFGKFGRFKTISAFVFFQISARERERERETLPFPFLIFLQKPKPRNVSMADMVCVNKPPFRVLILSNCYNPGVPEISLLQFEEDNEGKVMAQGNLSKICNVNSAKFSSFTYDVRNGLLFLADNYGRVCFVCNPCTGEHTTLQNSSPLDYPEPQRWYHNVFKYAFGFNPKTLEYKVLRLRLGSSGNNENHSHPRGIAGRGLFPQTRYECEVITLGKDSSWRPVGTLPQAVFDTCGRIVNNVAHWLLEERRGNPFYIVTFDLERETLGAKPHPPCCNDHTQPDFPHRMYLYELRGCLAVMDAEIDDHFNLWVMRDYETDVWTKDYHVVFHGLDMLDSAPPIPLDVWNGELLFWLDIGEEHCLVLYDVESCTFRKLGCAGARLPTRMLAITFEGRLFSLDSIAGKSDDA